jgi:hypothetical protein
MKITRTSTITGKTHTRDLPITEQQLAAYDSGVAVQDAFPHLSNADREFMLTGITAEEWIAAFGNDDEELAALMAEAEVSQE